MKDCGLKSYQDIQEPEYEEGILDPFERKVYLDEFVVDFFKEVMDVQEETGANIWFDWLPDKVLVYCASDAPWHKASPIEMIVDATFKEQYTATEMETQFDDMYLDLHKWRDGKVKNGKKG